MPTSAEALAALTAFQNAQENPLDVYNKQVTEVGAPDARNRVNSLRTTLINTENALNNVDSSVTGRTAGSLVTEAQRQRLVNLERVPIASQYSSQSRSLEGESANLSDLLGKASTNTNLFLQGSNQKLGNLKDIYNIAAQQEAEAARKAESERAFNESVRQFNASMASAASARASSAAANAPTREGYNSELADLESNLRAFQAAGYQGNLPSRDQVTNSLIAAYKGTISPEEINGYVKTLYNRYYLG